MPRHQFERVHSRTLPRDAIRMQCICGKVVSTTTRIPGAEARLTELIAAANKESCLYEEWGHWARVSEAESYPCKDWEQIMIPSVLQERYGLEEAVALRLAADIAAALQAGMEDLKARSSAGVK